MATDQSEPDADDPAEVALRRRLLGESRARRERLEVGARGRIDELPSPARGMENGEGVSA